MKILFLLLFAGFAIPLYGQKLSQTKPSTIDFHVFYSDFNAANNIRHSSLSTVLDQKQWSKISDMQMGIGFSYLKGINKRLDAVGTLDGSYVDYRYQNGTTQGSSKFLLDINLAAQIKALPDKYSAVPYISCGVGFSTYNGKSGFYTPVGLGIQFNVFNAAFVFAQMQYRLALSEDVNYHFRYSVGIATSISGKKQVKNLPESEKPTEQPKPIAKEKGTAKDLSVTVNDVQTGQPLPYVDIVINGPEGKNITGTTDANGQVVFAGLSPAKYTVAGMLNGIKTTSETLSKSSFSVDGNNVAITLTHNDPRFTLSGIAMNKSTNRPEGGVEINITNETKSSIATKQSSPGNGSFHAQLEAGSDFTIIGKKASYISNIEKVSTKGLNRSSTLYVKLELLVEEATSEKSIVLNNIYYDLGSATIRSSASSDLEKLLQFMKDNPTLRIEVASHTDSRGSDAANMKLSISRAQTIADYLIKRGIAANRIVAKGYGETKPVNGCKNGVKCTEAQYQQNRRTEFTLVK